MLYDIKLSKISYNTINIYLCDRTVQITWRQTISDARSRQEFIRPTHFIWSLAFSVSVMPSASAICFTSRRKSAVSESLPRRRFSVVDQSEHFTAKPPLKKQVFVQYLLGGDGGNRTRVRKPVTGAFYECSGSFDIPSAHRRTAGFAHQQPLDHDGLKGVGPFTCTAK